MKFNHQFNFIILGFSGAGKGTQAEFLARKFKMDVIDGGDYLRELAASQTLSGLKLRERMRQGHLAPTDIVRKWLKKQILAERKNGLIISGQPRMINEAKLVLEWFKQKNDGRDLRVFFLRVSEKEVVHRMEKRYVCKGCGKSFAIDDFKGTERCKTCSGEIAKRMEDSPLGIKNRLKYFNEQVVKTLEYFKQQGILIEINGEQSPEKVHEDILREIEKLSAAKKE